MKEGTHKFLLKEPPFNKVCVEFDDELLGVYRIKVSPKPYGKTAGDVIDKQVEQADYIQEAIEWIIKQ